MTWSYLFFCLMMIGLVGCGAISPRAHTGDDADCEYREETGSRVPVKVCQTEEEERQRALDDQLAVDDIHRNTPAPTPEQMVTPP